MSISERESDLCRLIENAMPGSSERFLSAEYWTFRVRNGVYAPLHNVLEGELGYMVYIQVWRRVI